MKNLFPEEGMGRVGGIQHLKSTDEATGNRGTFSPLRQQDAELTSNRTAAIDSFT